MFVVSAHFVVRSNLISGARPIVTTPPVSLMPIVLITTAADTHADVNRAGDRSQNFLRSAWTGRLRRLSCALRLTLRANVFARLRISTPSCPYRKRSFDQCSDRRREYGRSRHAIRRGARLTSSPSREKGNPPTQRHSSETCFHRSSHLSTPSCPYRKRSFDQCSDRRREYGRSRHAIRRGARLTSSPSKGKMHLPILHPLLSAVP